MQELGKADTNTFTAAFIARYKKKPTITHKRGSTDARTQKIIAIKIKSRKQDLKKLSRYCETDETVALLRFALRPRVFTVPTEPSPFSRVDVYEALYSSAYTTVVP